MQAYHASLRYGQQGSPVLAEAEASAAASAAFLDRRQEAEEEEDDLSHLVFNIRSEMNSKAADWIRQIESEKAECDSIEARWQEFGHEVKEGAEVLELFRFAEFPNAPEWQGLEGTIAKAKMLIADHYGHNSCYVSVE